MLRPVLSAFSTALALSLPLVSLAQVADAAGEAEVSVKQAGDLVNARRLARDKAERDVVVELLRVRVNVNPADPKAVAGLDSLRKQLGDQIKTTFTTEGDVLKARSKISADSAQVFDLARSLGITSSTAMESARVLFLIDEFVGVGTKLDPSRPTSTEIDYSHDKSEFADRTAKSSGAQSQSQSSASASKSAVAVASREAAAQSGSSSSSFSGRDNASMAVRGSAGMAINDGQGGAAAAARNYAGAAARNSQYAGANSQANASSYSGQFAGSAQSEKAAAQRSASASNFSDEQRDVSNKNDIVNLRVKQTFPDLGNAKPQDDSLIAARLQEVVGRYGVKYVPERDFRVEGGRRMLISDIERLSKFNDYMAKASKSNFNAQYIVYGSGNVHLEGTTAAGRIACGGQIKLESTNVGTGEGLVSATIVKRADGSSDQDCRANLAQAMASNVAEVVGNTISRERQLIASQLNSFQVTLYSALRIPAKVRHEFTASLQKMANSVQEGDTTDSTRQWTVAAKGEFKNRLEDLMEEMSGTISEMKEARMKTKGTQIVICIEGKCPESL